MLPALCWQSRWSCRWEGVVPAVHESKKSDVRDGNSSYCLVTRDQRKASIWEVRPFWAAVPTPTRPPVQLDAAGTPKTGFHTAKKAALPAIRDAISALVSPVAE